MNIILSIVHQYSMNLNLKGAMRLPILFKTGLGLVMGSWALNVWSNSQQAVAFYRSVISSFNLTAYSAAIYKQSPMLFDIAGFTSLYTWIPVLVCMGVGFIASSILCALVELIISSVYELVKALLPLTRNLLDGAMNLGHDLYRLPKSERKERLRQACRCFIRIPEGEIQSTFSLPHKLTAWCITALILALYVERYFPFLSDRLYWLRIDTWFMGSGPQATLDFHAVLSGLLAALFGW